jgi:hypothetical protein
MGECYIHWGKKPCAYMGFTFFFSSPAINQLRFKNKQTNKQKRPLFIAQFPLLRLKSYQIPLTKTCNSNLLSKKESMNKNEASKEEKEEEDAAAAAAADDDEGGDVMRMRTH